MSFDFDLALQIFEKMPVDERKALLTAANFLMSTTAPDGTVYSFLARNTGKIVVSHDYEDAKEIRDRDGVAGFTVVGGRRRVRVHFECDATDFLGLQMTRYEEKPTNHVEEYLKKIAEEPILDREERAALIL